MVGSERRTITRTAVFANNTLRGTVSAAPDGSFYVVDNQVFNSVLSPTATIGPSTVGLPVATANTAAAAFGVASTGTATIRVQAAIPPNSPVQSLQRFNIFTLQPDVQVSLPEQVLDLNLAQIGQPNFARLWPPRPVALELGVNNQTQLLRRGMVLNGTDVYVLTLSGLSVVSLTPAAGRTPQLTGVINGANRVGSLSPGGVITINGNNLADSATASGTPLPKILAGVCVTANEVTIPLFSTSPTQIQAQLPPDLATGRVTLTVRSSRLGLSSNGTPISITATGPAVFSVPVDGVPRAALIHSEDAALVTPDYPAQRDETLLLYATGLGPVRPAVGAGVAGASDPLSETMNPVSVAIGEVPYLVTWAGLAPDTVGIYQINVYVPGGHVEGDDLPVVVTVGGTSSATTNAPTTSVH